MIALQHTALIDGQVIADNVKIAENFFTRATGLLGKSTIHCEEGLLIRPCRQVHTFFMRFDIDVLFLLRSGEIVFIKESMAPGNVSPFVKNCFGVLELKSGTVKDHSITVSKRVNFE